MSTHDDPSSAPEPTPEELAAKDEKVHVPRGQSRTRFLIIIGLMIFTLVIYVVPSQFQDFFRRSKPTEDAYFVWQHPVDGRQALSYVDFTMETRRLGDFLNVCGVRDDDFTSEEQIARVLVLDRLAQDAGIEITDSELRDAIREGGFLILSKPSNEDTSGMPMYFFQMPPIADAATLRLATESRRTTPVAFQETRRQLMRIERFEALLGYAVQPDPASIESAWKKMHQEHAFEFVAVDVEASRAEADAQAPDETALRAWYDALDLARKRMAFAAEWKQDRVSAELLVWKFDEVSEPALLLEKHPRPEGADLEKLAKDYYNQFANVRFRREVEKPDAPTAAERLYKPYEEVAETAQRESKVHAALVEYSIALQSRLKAGEPVDLAAEAALYGLAYVREDDPKTQVDWAGYPGLGDPALAASILRASRSDSFVPLAVTATQATFGRTTGRIEASAPPFDEVKDKALAEWKTDKTRELAQAKAQAFYDLVKAPDPSSTAVAAPEGVVKADQASFAAKAQSAGVTVAESGWIDERELSSDELGADANELQRFQRELALSLRAQLQNEPDVVSGPQTSMAKDRIYVVRKVGKRDPEAVHIEPKDYEQLKGQATFERTSVVRDQMIGFKGLEARYGATFPGRKPATEPEAPAKQG